MKSLLQVAKLISRQKLRKLDILTEDLLDSKASKFRDLYDALQDGTVRNDREAAKLLYDASPTDARYRQLKSRFRKRLFNTLFFVDQNRPHATSFDQTYHNSQRDWSLICILRANEATGPARALAKTLLKRCEQYGFAEMTVQAARFLADCAASEGDLRSLRQLEASIDGASATHRIELESERHLRAVKLIGRKVGQQASCSVGQEAEALAIGGALEGLTRRSESSVVRYNLHDAWCRIHQLRGERRRLISTVEAAIAFSDANPRQLQVVRLRELKRRRLYALIELRDFTGGVAAIGDSDANCQAGDAAWFELRKLEVALHLRCGRAVEALAQCTHVKRQRAYRQIGAPDKEMWELLTAASWIASHDHGKNPESVPEGFDAAAFLRKQPVFGGELLRLNAWRLLLQACLFKQRGQDEEASDTIDRLRELAIRKLDGKRDVRFIAAAQILFRAAKYEFDLRRDRVGQRHLGVLVETRFAVRVRQSAFEPICLRSALGWFGIQHEALAVAA